MNFLFKYISNLLRSPQSRAYFDYASITPVDERVVKVMNTSMRKYPANPSSLYAEGVSAEKFLNMNRSDIANMFEIHADEVVFTSGGTESNNLAIKGILNGAVKKGIVKPHIISLVTEHPSIREVLSAYDVTYVPVDEEGIIDLKEFKAALRPETVLATVMYANNEIGVIQPIHEIAKIIRGYRKEQGSEYPFFHTDACQAAAYCSMRIPALGVDLMTIDGGKVYGPRGIGFLFIKRHVQPHLLPELLGGGQEYGKRAGTENLSATAGLCEALKICFEEKEREVSRLTEMRDRLIAEIQKIIPSATLNGSTTKRLPNNINICIPGKDAEFEVLRLDANGICVSSVTSCMSKAEDNSSYVIEGIGKKGCAASSLRITLGRFTTKSEILFLLERLRKLY